MNYQQAIFHARGILMENDIDDAPLEGELLLRYILGINRTQLYTYLDSELSNEQEDELSQAVHRRVKGEPSAYITGHREFYGIDFYVDSNVLIPRPESELLVEKAIKLIQSRHVSVIADTGTGCGAIAISLALNIPHVTIYATDISASALSVAKINCRKHEVTDRVKLLQGDMLEPLPEPVDIIIANLPYVCEPDIRESGPLHFEPWLALNGGTDGLAKIYSLYNQAGDKLKQGGYILVEIGRGQVKPVTAFLRQVLPSVRIEITNDFAGIERVISLCLT